MSVDRYWMGEAYKLAEYAQDIGEIPVGAVLVDEDNQLIGKGWNQSILDYDPTAHAEIIAIRNASLFKKNHRLLKSTLYVTLEPCCMCAGALVQARIQRLVFAARDFKAGAAGSVFNILSGFPLNHKVQVDEGPLQHECSSLLTSFFRDLD